MSRRPTLSPAVSLGLIRAAAEIQARHEDNTAPAIDLESAAPPPVRSREPYAVERYPAPGGFVQLVGYDRHGEFMCATTIPAKRFNDRSQERMRRWCMKNDTPADPPTLSLLPD